MKIFACYLNSNAKDANCIIDELFHVSDNKLTILREEQHSDQWKKHVENKFVEVDFILFIISKETFISEAIQWEYKLACRLNKRIVGIKLDKPNTIKDKSIYDFQIFDTPGQCYEYLRKIFEDDRQLLIEQYKIMVGSTEKVTEQRMKVNNLFFTATSSILSISLVLGKAFNFSIIGGIGMLILATMSFVISFLWEKLVSSYGKLNTGKFMVIDQIEKRLRTNMFEHEWNILIDEVNYESNTKTEVTVVKRFRLFIIFVIVLEIIFLICKTFFPSII